MKRAWILVIVAIVILGIIFIPKIISNEGDNEVKFMILEQEQIPDDIENILPRYMSEERALSCKVDEDVYIIVTRGEKRTAGYSVTIDRIVKQQKDDTFDLIVYAKYKDPKPDQIVAQTITYPVVVAKAKLDELPDKIKLETAYIDGNN